MNRGLSCLTTGVLLAACCLFGAADVSAQDSGGISYVIIDGRPPADYRAPAVALPASNKAKGINILSEVPAFDWSYGCSATSAAMLAGYYDRHGYVDMYTGTANGGVCPLYNDGNPIGSSGHCSLSATEDGLDGRVGRGHVDDYWIAYGNCDDDPYIQNGWPEHTWEDCTGDFMGTNQSALGNCDGATTFWYYQSGDPLYDYDPGPNAQDGCHGLRLFLESRGYTVETNFTQLIKGKGDDPDKGFTFEDYCAEIDAGRPVLIQVENHTMLGFGYDTAGSTIYLHDTWDWSDHTMTWGSVYAGSMEQWGVTVVRLQALGPTSEVIFRLAPDDPSIPASTFTLGIHPQGTDAFDAGLDEAAPSWPPDPAVRMAADGVSGSPDALDVDYRDGAVEVDIAPYWTPHPADGGLRNEVWGLGAVDGAYPDTVVIQGNNLGPSGLTEGELTWDLSQAGGYTYYLYDVDRGVEFMLRQGGSYRWTVDNATGEGPTLVVSCTSASPQYRKLLADGWNLIGLPGDVPVVWADCQVTDGVEVKSISDAEVAGWLQSLVYYFEPGGYRAVHPAGMGDDDHLRPWVGYWLLTYRAGLTLLVPAP